MGDVNTFSKKCIFVFVQRTHYSLLKFNLFNKKFPFGGNFNIWVKKTILATKKHQVILTLGCV